MSLLRRPSGQLMVITLAVAALHTPLFSSRLIEAHDLFFYQRRALDYLEALRHGPNTIPIWSENAVGGMGRAFFLYSAPLMNFVNALLTAVLGGVLAVHMSLLLVMILASLSVYFWLREIFSDEVAFLGALSFASTDYVMRESLARGALAEAAALMFFGWCLWAVERAFARNEVAMLPLIALFFGGLVLSHNLSMIFCGPALVGYILLARLRYERWPARGLALAMPFVGLLVSCFFWAPTFVYSDWLQTERFAGKGRRLDYMNTAQLFSIGHTSLALKAEQRLAFSGFTLAGALGLGVLILKQVGDEAHRRFGWTMVLGTGLTFFLMSSAAKFLYVNIKLLQFLQFPWRMFVLVSFFMCGLSALMFAWITARWGRRTALVLVLLLIPPLVSGLDYARRTKREDRPTPANVKAMRALGDVSFTFEDVSAHRCVPRGKVKGTVTAANVFSADGPVEFTDPVLAFGRRATKFVAEEEAAITLKTAYSPLWEVRIDGEKVATECTEEGHVSFSVQPGSGEVRAVIVPTLLMVVTQWLSLATFVALLGALVYLVSTREKIAPEQEA